MMFSGEQDIVVAALYKFVHLHDYKELREPLLGFCKNRDIRGTLLLAPEGINGTVAGSRGGIDELMAYLDSDPRFSRLEYKESITKEMPFYRTKVKLKNEIVTMGVAGLDPSRASGIHVKPKDWNTLISDPDVMIIDTRNKYEYQIGTFRNAISPETESFSDFPEYVDKNLKADKQRPVAMFCTGGIRCEKASAYLLEQGFTNVYQLQGGILKYLQEVSPEESLWQGECFVFDNRVAVDKALQPGIHEMCYGCRHPVSPGDRESDKYEQGVSCPDCYGKLTDERKTSLRERQRQVELATKRNARHIGVPIPSSQKTVTGEV